MECLCSRCEHCRPHFKTARTILQPPCLMEDVTNARARAYCEQYDLTCVPADDHSLVVVVQTTADLEHGKTPVQRRVHYDKCVRTVGWEISLEDGGLCGFNVGDLFESLFEQACDAQNRMLIYYPGSFFLETSRDLIRDTDSFHLTGSFGVLRTTNQ